MHKIRATLRTARHHASGFTLIELMIVVAIIGILVKLAYPAYTASVLKSHRAEAKTALLDLASREERYFSTTNTFTASAPALGYSSTATLTTAAPLSILTGTSIYYKLSVQVPDPSAGATSAPSFLATATAVNTQTSDTKCKDFSLTQAGIQSVNGTDAASNCW